MKIGISPQLIKSVATIYTGIYRVFMEFIDNSLDAAENVFDERTQSYTRPIEIEIKFSGSSLENFKVEITDNCGGISDLSKVVSSIGNSSKKDVPFANGQFGFGMCSFIALCNKMTITSCVDGATQYRAVINSDIFDNDEIQDTEVIMSAVQTHLRMNFRVLRTGTTVCLEEFSSDKYKQISIQVLIAEIEKHFEILLRRQGLKLSVKFPNNTIHICKTFDYDRYKGEIYFNKITTLRYTACKKTGEKGTINIEDKPVVIFLKVINDKAIERRPYFVIKGRRITEVSDVKAFRSISKSMIWSHPNITGYIDVTGCLEPTIARNEFKDSKIVKALFSTLLEEELKIKEFVEASLNTNLKGKYKKLETLLENTLNEVAKELSKAKRKNKKSENNLKYLREEERDNYQSFTIENRNRPFDNDSVGTGIAREIRAEIVREPKKRYTRILLPSINIARSEEKKENGLGFTIRIDCENEPLKNDNDQKVRSIVNGNEIIIYQRHPEFESRLTNSRDGIPRISVNVINYLCSEILIHFKLLGYLNSGQPEEAKDILNDFADSLYSFERRLNSLEGKKLSDFK